MRFRRPLLILVLAAQSLPGISCQSGATVNTKDQSGLEAKVDSIAEAALNKSMVPGLSVAVMRGPDVILAKGYGFADVEKRVPATPSTIYQIGSISKQFTAAAIMRLVEQGRMRLDDPITKYLPDYPTQGHTVLVRHLLHQTSGIKEFFTIQGYDEMDISPPEKHSRDDLISLFKKQPFQFAPGERWAYSNSNYTLLGRIIETVSGKTYDQYLRESFFAPLGLKATSQCDARLTGDAHAKGYFVKDGAVVIAPQVNMNMAIGDGGLCSTVLDLVKWKRALVNSGVVTGSSYDKMISSEPVRRGYKPAYGFGLSLVGLDGLRRVAHNGEVGGFTGTLAHYPDKDITIAVLTNIGHIWPEAIEKAIARAAHGLPTPVTKDVPVEIKDRQRYVGTYDFGVFPLRVIEEGGRLKFDMKMGRVPYVLLYQGDQVFVAESDPDAIRLTFSVSGERAGKMLIEMAGMHWYAERVK
jgi:CubicO group peptidase (beta-lactamase class C family)